MLSSSQMAETFSKMERTEASSPWSWEARRPFSSARGLHKTIVAEDLASVLFLLEAYGTSVKFMPGSFA